MLERREMVSAETIDRAIRARLAMDHGTKSPYVIVALPIQETDVDADGLNWSLLLDADATPLAGIEAVWSAAAVIAARFNLHACH